MFLFYLVFIRFFKGKLYFFPPPSTCLSNINSVLVLTLQSKGNIKYTDGLKLFRPLSSHY